MLEIITNRITPRITETINWKIPLPILMVVDSFGRALVFLNASPIKLVTSKIECSINNINSPISEAKVSNAFHYLYLTRLYDQRSVEIDGSTLKALRPTRRLNVRLSVTLFVKLNHLQDRPLLYILDKSHA